jgi:diguanylate cyclase (GGDEF)-like protein/PAS domain S-box-containing protein
LTQANFNQQISEAEKYIAALKKIGATLPPEQQVQMSTHLAGLNQILDELNKHQADLKEGWIQQPDSEGRHHSLFENQHTVMLLINPQTGTILDANPAAVSFYGYSREAFFKLNISDLSTLPASEVKKEMERARNKQQLYSSSKHRLANNEVRDVEVYSGPINMGGVQLLFSVIHDNTERKQTDEALDRERRLLRTVIDNLPDQIFARDRDCRFILNNLSDTRMMGMDDPTALLGKSDHDFYQPDLADRYQADDRKVMESDQPLINLEEPIITPEGQQCWVNTTKVPLHNSQGQVIGLVGIAHDITGRKQAEEALRRSEEKYRNLFEEAIEGIVQTSPDGKYINVNKSYVKMLGYDSAEEMIHTVTDIASQVYTNPEDRDRMLQLLAEHDDRLENFEYQAIRKDGQKIWLSLNLKSIYKPNGELMRLDGRVEDITERKKAELSLQQKTEELDRFFNIALDLLCIADTDGIFKHLNRAWETTLGFSLDELTGSNFLDYVHPEDLDSTLAAMAKLSNQNPIINFVNRYRCQDGSYRWIEWRSAPAGKLIYAAARDITARKQVEEELFNSQRMLQLILDTVPQRVFWKDRNFTFLGCNRPFALDAGLNASSEIIGKNDYDLNWKENAALYRVDDQWVMENNTPKLNFEEYQCQPDGTQLWLRTNKVPLHDRDGKVIGLMGAYEDITDRKLAEEQLKLTNEKLTATVSTLEKRNQEANLMREMDDLLQVCNVSDEAYTVIQQFAPRLFPSTSGALFLFNNSHRAVEAVSIWGENLQSEHIFAADDCWTLRRGQFHQWNTSTPGLRCRHIPPSFSGDYLDAPMLAASELIGLLHIENADTGWRDRETEELSRSLAEHLALSLSNLKLREKLHSQSIRDLLTGLFNRRYMEESLEREIHRAARGHFPVGIVMLDIDHFKDFNDTYGHEAGDVVLHELGTLLQSQIRGGDIACRFGGEEFILILPDTSLEITRQRAEKIRRASKDLIVEYQNKPLGIVSLSLGVTVFPTHSTTAQGLLRKADKALYQAKHNGRDRVEIVEDIS